MTDPAPPLLGPGDAHALPTWRAAYSDRTAAMMAAFAELVYSPAQSIAPAIAAGGFSLPAVFTCGNVQAFLAVNPGEFAVLAFRGTANAADWGIDLDAIRIPMPGVPGIGVHAGFWNAWTSLAADVRKCVDAYVPADLGLYITGHSLAGALAQIAAAELERDNLAACYTFGSPRVATRDFDTVVKCPHYRVIDRWDLVPGVPAPSPGGYLHGGDPRLLVGDTPRAALRRDRGLLGRLVVYAWSFLVWPLTRDLGVVDDHMIQAYRLRLEGIARARV